MGCGSLASPAMSPKGSWTGAVRCIRLMARREAPDRKRMSIRSPLARARSVRNNAKLSGGHHSEAAGAVGLYAIVRQRRLIRYTKFSFSNFFHEFTIFSWRPRPGLPLPFLQFSFRPGARIQRTFGGRSPPYMTERFGLQTILLHSAYDQSPFNNYRTVS